MILAVTYAIKEIAIKPDVCLIFSGFVAISLIAYPRSDVRSLRNCD